MELLFTGWKRIVHYHQRSVTPADSLARVLDRKSLNWNWPDRMTAYGKIEGLSLSGDYLVEFKTNKDELRSLLTSFFETDPVAAQKLISEVQLNAIKSLKKKKVSKD